MSEEEKLQFFNKQLYAIKGVGNKLETKVKKILELGNIEHQMSFWITKKHQYDFLFPKFKILLEVQGDYWHANPEKYKPNDLIKYPNEEILASEIWNRDLEKRKFAEKHRLSNYLYLGK